MRKKPMRDKRDKKEKQNNSIKVKAKVISTPDVRNSYCPA